MTGKLEQKQKKNPVESGEDTALEIPETLLEEVNVLRMEGRFARSPQMSRSAPRSEKPMSSPMISRIFGRLTVVVLATPVLTPPVAAPSSGVHDANNKANI